MKTPVSKGIMIKSLLSYLFWAVGMRLYYVDTAMDNSLVPSIVAVAISSMCFFWRNCTYKQSTQKQFPQKHKLIESLFCLITFLLPRISLPHGLNILLLDIVSVLAILVMRSILGATQ